MDTLLFLLHRTRQRWQMLLLLLMSVTVSAALLSSGPLLVDAVMRLALPYKLRTAEPLDSNLRLTAYDKPEAMAYQVLDAHLRLLAGQNLVEQHPKIIASAGSGWLYPWYLEQLLRDERIQLRFMEELQNHARLSEGTWPDSALQAAAMQEKVIYAVIPPVLAQAFDLQVGDRLPLSRKEAEREPSAWLEVSGILEPLNSQETYWFGDYSPLVVRTESQYLAEYSAIVDQASFFQLQAELFPNSNAQLNWNILLEPETVQVENVSRVREGINGLRSGLEEITPAVALQTHLDKLLEEFVSQVRVVRITLYVVLVEVLFLALYFLSMAAGMAVQQVEGEFASLASRGASFGQVFKIQASEACVIGLVAFLVGPILAWLAILGLGRFGPFRELSQSMWLPAMPWTAWLAAGLGALAGTVFLLLPVYPAVQRSVVTHAQRTTRPEQAAWWQRAYLDVFAALGAALLVWRLRSYGSVAATGQVDWMLLLAPLALLVSSAILMLRLYPLIMKGMARLAARGRGLPAALALWYTARNPTQVIKLVLLLVLTMALAILSSGLDFTLDRVESERARYAAGADVRILMGDQFEPVDTSNLPGLVAESRVWRGTGSIALASRRSIPIIDMLALEPFSFAQVTRYRSDYADDSIGELLGKLVVDDSYQSTLLLPLPGQPAKFGLWVYDKVALNSPKRLVDNIYLQAKLQTAQGDNFVVPLVLTPVDGRLADQPAPFTEWRYFEAELPALSAADYPLVLHSLWLKARPEAADSFMSIQINLDDFSVTDRNSGEVSIVEDFEGIKHIWQTSQREVIASFSRKAPAHSGSGTLTIWLPSELFGQMQALYLAEGFFQEPLPTLASEEFIAQTQVAVGDRIDGFANGQEVPMVIVGVVRYFPTLYDSPGHGFLILPRSALLTILNRQQRIPINPDELWLEVQTAQAASRAAQAVPGAARAVSYQDELQSIKADPLTLGLRSVTLLGALLAALLSLVGFATYFYMSLERRETTFAILRSLGLSSGQLIGMLTVEQSLMILTGLLMGTLLGLLLNGLVLPGLPLTLGGRPAIPPLITATDWSALFQFYLFLVLAFSLVLGLAIVFLWRSRLQNLLRIGQE